jgi:hypothetical protein
MKVIGIGGVSRCGKNLFATVATRLLEEQGKTSIQFSLARNLKLDMSTLMANRIGINSLTEDTKEKNIIRPLLVSYGDITRKMSKGTMWTSAIEPEILARKEDYVFITDLRYDHYEQDEVYWVQHILRGKIVHIKCYTMQPAPSKRHITTSTPLKTYTPPANENEIFNDPKVYKKADVRMEWECKPEMRHPDTNEYIEQCVRDVLPNLL